MRPRIEEFHHHLARIFPSENYGKRIRTVTIQVTDSCNLRCSYCYQINKGQHFISFGTARKFLEMILTGNNPLITFDNSSGMILEFIGGEPLLAIELIDELTGWVIQYMIDHHHPWLHRFRVSISTNGTLYFDPRVQTYLKRYGSYVSMSFSIDGNRELHDACRIHEDGSGSYDQAIAAAIHYRSAGHNPGSKMTLSPDNIGYTAAALENLIELGYESIFCNCVFEEGWTRSHARVLYNELVSLTDWLDAHGLLDEVYISIFEHDMFRPIDPSDDRNWCGGTGDMIAVDYKGDIFPCLRYMESSIGCTVKPPIIGIVDGGIAVTDDQRTTIECFKCATGCSQSTDECCRCPIAKGCAWCSAYNYQITGNVNRRATFICEMHKARALANVYFWIRYNRAMNIIEPIVNNVPDEWAIPIIGQLELDRLKALLAEDKRRIENIHAI